MGRSSGGCDADSGGDADELPEHDATVEDFYLDVFEVTVGRFRKFVEQYDGTPPAADAGAHPSIAGSGWQSAWNSDLYSTAGTLKVNLDCGHSTWSDTPDTKENVALNCIDWYHAFAFCIWDGGRLPTEAEWEYASAGGSQNRRYPWGQQDGDETLANSWDHGLPFMTVGSYPAGVSRWGQHDLAGGMSEWVLDWYAADWYAGAGNVCSNCANLTDGTRRVTRGGNYSNATTWLRAATRGSANPQGLVASWFVGFRCARSQ